MLARNSVKLFKGENFDAIHGKMNSAFEWRDEETLYWVALDQSQIGLGFRKLQMIYDRLGSMERFWQADPLDLQEMGTDTVYGLPFLTEEVIGKFLKYRQSTDLLSWLPSLRRQILAPTPIRTLVIPAICARFTMLLPYSMCAASLICQF